MNFGYVYIIKFADSSGKEFYKIGLTKYKTKRISYINTVIPFKIQLVKICYVPSYRTVEKHMHTHFKKFKILNEWFDLKKVEDEAIKELMSFETKDVYVC